MTTIAIPTETPTAIPTEISTETTTDAHLLVDANAENSDPPLEAKGEAVEAEGPESDVPEKPPCEMKFTVKQDDLLRVLTLVMKAISVRPLLPVLSHVLVATRKVALEGVPAQVVLTCSNLEIGRAHV